MSAVKISINLTTTSERLDLCSATIWSFINQSLTPDAINLWVSRTSFMADNGIEIEPDWISYFNKFNNILKIRYVDNTGPYRKFMPILQETTVESDIIVYADDDVIYGRYWLEKLITKFKKYDGKYVVASRVRIKKYNVLKKAQSYNMYPVCSKDTIIKSDYIITGVGGAVFQKRQIRNDLIGINKYKEICPRTDDLWISKLFELSGNSVCVCTEALNDVREIQHASNSLNSMNVYHTNHIGVIKIIAKIRFKILGYLGVSLSENDHAMKKIERFFSKYKK
ncbi:glycosyltransferase [Klebsiella pneumoniae]